MIDSRNRPIKITNYVYQLGVPDFLVYLYIGEV